MFFTQSEIKTKAKVETDYDTLLPLCKKCKLDKTCRTPKMKVEGKGKKKILVLASSPSMEDDIYGSCLSGPEGDILRHELKKNRIKLNRDCWRISAVRCYSGDDPTKHPKKNSVKYCAPSIKRLIHHLKPKNILICGSAGIVSILDGKIKKITENQYRGLIIPDIELHANIGIIIDPRTIEYGRNRKDKILRNVFNRDIENIINGFSNKTFYDKDYKKYITVYNNPSDFEKIIKLLEDIKKNKKTFYFDYEGTGLKPQNKGHKIVSISIAFSSKEAYAFPLDWKDFWTKSELKTIKGLFSEILANKKIKKIAHHTKFEDNWSKVILGTRVKSFIWDTMTAAHIIDNRSRFTGLKFQIYANFGIRPYDTEIEKFLKGDDTGFNRVEEAPLNDLLVYNGFDTLYGWMLYNKQLSIFAKNTGLQGAYKLFHKGDSVMSEMQLNGMKANEKYYRKQLKSLGKEVSSIKKKLEKGKEAKKFKKKYNIPLKITSNDHLGKLFYDVLKVPPIYTDNGNYKTDEKTLSSLEIPFVQHLIKMKKLEKARGTYITSIIREISYGRIHPNFSLNIPKTYRSSSSNPNFQNFPKRNKLIMQIIRTGLTPSPGCVLTELDFSGAEVITSVCVTGDTLIETINGSISIKKAIKKVKKGEPVYVYGYSLEEKRIKISKITDGGKTGKRKEVWKVTLDNGEVIRATPNHKFLVRNGSNHEGVYVELQNLTKDMSLMPFVKKEKNGYYYVNLNNRKQIAEHTLIGIDVLGEDVGGSCSSDLIHHKDGNKLNNNLDNLEFMDRESHTRLHHKGKVTGPYSEEHKLNISKALKGVTCPQRAVNWTPEKRKNLSNGLKGRIFSDDHRKNLSDSKKYYWKNKSNEMCKICGKEFRKVTNTHLLNKHDITLEEYKKEYNHKVLSIEFDGYEDVYNINVDGIHNYATSAGVIIKNCYHKDKNFYNYLMDKSTDMHRDNASDLWILPPGMLDNPKYTPEQKKLAKDIRFYAKNQWTFAQFYGDWFGACAPLLWESTAEGGLILPNGVKVIDHMKKQGVYNLNDFKEHCREVEDKMWNKRFPGYNKWKDENVELFMKQGYLETYFGFRFTGRMDRNQICNYQIQGTSFHLLMYTLIEISKNIKREKMKTKLIGQIHDAVIGDTPVEEINEYSAMVNEVVGSLFNKFDWLIVPMEIEAEKSLSFEEGGNFSSMEPYKIAA